MELNEESHNKSSLIVQRHFFCPNLEFVNYFVLFGDNFPQDLANFRGTSENNHGHKI